MTARSGQDDDPAIAQPRLPEKADAVAWLALAAGALGALMASLDISVVNSALPTIQGEIGASGTEGTWIATAYLVAEIIVIPLSGWLERVFGLRTLLLIAASLFTLFSILCGLSTTLPMMIVGRVGQGLTGGVLIPTAMTIIATRLPRQQQTLGNAIFGSVMILGPIAGPAVGGWLTENFSWHYAFFINLPIGIALLTLLILALPHRKARLDLALRADWLGIVGLTLGMGGVTIVLEEGQRELWFASAMIVRLSLMSAVGFALLIAGQFLAARPVIMLKLLLSRAFGSVIIMVMAIGVVIYGTSYIIPQYLSAIAGYNAYQSGLIVLLSGLPVLLTMPFIPFLMRTVDIRIAVAGGLLVLGVAAWIGTRITPQSTGGDFVVAQLVRGFGTILAMAFLNQAAIRSVPVESASDAAGLYNAFRNLGGSMALAGISVFQDRRMWLHSRRLEETYSANSVQVQDYVAAQTRLYGTPERALQALEDSIQRQALTMTYIDLFWMLMVGMVVILPLVFFLRPLPANAPPVATH